MANVAGKVAVVTGSGTGLGRELALQLAKDGATVVLVGRRLEKIVGVQGEIEALGGQVLAVQADVSNEEDVKRMQETVEEKLGRIDILFNNAGVFEVAPVAEMSFASWSRLMQSNLNTMFLATRAFIPMMRKQQYGRIVSITSSLAYAGWENFGAYAASKAGVDALTRTVATEEGKNGILINALCPGALRTDMNPNFGEDPKTVVPALIELATLPEDGKNGQVLQYQSQTA